MSDVSISKPAMPRRVPKWVKERSALFGLCVLVFVGFACMRPVIASAGNVQNILVQASYLAIFAAAQALVIMTRGFDLSLGVAVSLISVLSAMVMHAHAADPATAILLGVLAACATGAIIGALNGVCVAFAKMNPFVVTLGTMNMVLALSTTVSGGFPVSPLPASFVALSGARVAGVPLLIVMTVLIAIGLQVVLSRTVFERSIILIGANRRAARLAGIASRMHLGGAYVVCSVIVAIGALLLTARTGSGEPNLGGDLTLQTVAAAVLGGIRLSGGEGDVFAPVLGALLVTILSNGMNLIGFDGYLQRLVLGGVIVAALAVDRHLATRG
ncbi:Ribose ABC transport system, permease protein RbsC [Candidatus Burkholderia verschuerenii]|uniref:Ribose ABC transport system, permease protein RbsC n=1 Tax=Candidatus Burkholderia verschuerenii TaxID=242163 RepID=A0A0L0MAK7_9BURK|nr:ABC transporter permease [Candidatus Burkholderia verschuerenii]KND59742.1 Ribose ABC transport system, permease protein RbsC [Candidatus Burkholderia verschuerenii]